MLEDIYFWLACEHAKDDYFLFGIKRTQIEVEDEAKKLRRGDNN